MHGSNNLRENALLGSNKVLINTSDGLLPPGRFIMSADALTVGCKRNVKPEMAELKGKNA